MRVGAGTKTDRLLGRDIAFVAGERRLAEPTEDDPTIVGDEAGVPALCADTLAYLRQPLVQATRRHLAPDVRADAHVARSLPLERESEGAPVGF